MKNYENYETTEIYDDEYFELLEEYEDLMDYAPEHHTREDWQ